MFKGKQPQITLQFEFLTSSISRRLQPTGRTAIQLQANTVRMHTGTRFYVMKRKGKNLTATEFFISATAEVNSLKWSSGQYTRGWTKSPQFLPALTQAFSHSSLLVRTAAWYFPVAIPWWDTRQNQERSISVLQHCTEPFCTTSFQLLSY